MAITTRSSGKIQLWLLNKSVVEEITGFKPPTVKLVYLHFRYHHLQSQDSEKGTSTIRNAAKLAAQSVKQWWLCKAAIPTKSENALILMIEKIHKEWTKLFKQRNVDTAIQERNRKRFIGELDRTFWAPQPNCEKTLCDFDVAFLENMRTTERQGGIGSFDKSLHQKNQRKQARVDATLKAYERQQMQLNEPIPSLTLNEPDEESRSEEEVDEEEDQETQLPRKKKRREPLILKFDPHTWSKSVCSAADKNKVSHRAMTEIVSAMVQTGGGDINDMSLSRETVRRHRAIAREDIATTVLKSQLSSLSDGQYGESYVLHWDSKMLKPLEHAGTKQEVLAILLTATHDESEILLSIAELEEGNAESEATKILDVLENLNINKASIVGLVYDTTSVNTGIHNGIVVRLERAIGHRLLQLPCRHHIHELLCGAAAKLVYGNTKSPSEEIFRIFTEMWPHLDKSNYDLCRPISRCMQDHFDEVIRFCQNALARSQNFCHRDDYKELLELTLIFLGGTLPDSLNFTMKAPGARHHARWMSKILYSLKIALLRNQLGEAIPDNRLDEITDLATFLCLFYVESWITSPSPLDAAKNDLNLFKSLTKNINMTQHRSSYPDSFLQMSTAMRNKLDNHLWYLSERLATLALFSDKVSIVEKQAIATNILKYKEENPDPNSRSEILLPIVGQSTQLKDLVGKDSWLLLSLLHTDPLFLSKPAKTWASDENPAKTWESDENYIHIRMLNSIKVVNDSAES